MLKMFSKGTFNEGFNMFQWRYPPWDLLEIGISNQQRLAIWGSHDFPLGAEEWRSRWSPRKSCECLCCSRTTDGMATGSYGALVNLYSKPLQFSSGKSPFWRGLINLFLWPIFHSKLLVYCRLVSLWYVDYNSSTRWAWVQLQGKGETET